MVTEDEELSVTDSKRCDVCGANHEAPVAECMAILDRKPLFDRESRAMHVRLCSRCRGDHDNILFAPLDRPIDNLYGYWALCPTNGQPILMAAFDMPEDEAS